MHADDWSHLLASSGFTQRQSLPPRASSKPWPDIASDGPRHPRVLSLGAGVQSTALLLLAAHGRIPSFDVALFADTMWEPASVYTHLERLIDEVAQPAGIPVVRVSYGDIRMDSISPNYTTVLPLFISNAQGATGMLSRQCTQNYKLLPIYRYVRKMLGAATTTSACRGCNGRGKRVPPSSLNRSRAAEGECSVCRGTGEQVRVGPVPESAHVVEMAIGFSTDEIQRVGPSRRKYVTHDYPLLTLGWTRDDARDYLQSHGFGATPRSACIGCPYHSQAEWRLLRDTAPSEWQDAVEFDALIRSVPGASGLQGEAYLHRKRLALHLAVLEQYEETDAPGCSPFGCRSSAAIDSRYENQLLDADEVLAL